MGYTTNFTGEFKLNKKLLPSHETYLRTFSEIRHMKRSATVAMKLPDPIRDRVWLPIGIDGRYYTGDDERTSILDMNMPPDGCPSFWCQWTIGKDRKSIVWDGGEKFYSYAEWLDFLIVHFLKPWGYVLNGKVEYNGETKSDVGVISVVDNLVRKIPKDTTAPVSPVVSVLAAEFESEEVPGKKAVAQMIREYIRSQIALRKAEDSAVRARQALGDEGCNIEGISLPSIIVVDGQDYVFWCQDGCEYEFEKIGSIL